MSDGHGLGSRRAEVVVAVADALSVAVAAIIGFAAGAVFTATHIAWPPIGMILGLIAIAALLVGYRLAFGMRRHAIGGAIGVTVAVALFAQIGLGGTILVRNDALGWAWVLLAPAAAAVCVVVPWGRPRGTDGDKSRTV